MKITVNGDAHEHQGTGTALSLIEELGATPAHTALMINGSVIPAEMWATAPLADNDEIEMLVFVGGG